MEEKPNVIRGMDNPGVLCRMRARDGQEMLLPLIFYLSFSISKWSPNRFFFYGNHIGRTRPHTFQSCRERSRALRRALAFRKSSVARREHLLNAPQVTLVPANKRSRISQKIEPCPTADCSLTVPVSPPPRDKQQPYAHRSVMVIV